MVYDAAVSTPEAFYVYLKENHYKVIANIIFAGSPGHQIQELDYFLRKYQANETPPANRYLWIQGTGALTNVMADLYGEHFKQYNLQMIADETLFNCSKEILRLVPEFGIDVGLSHLRYSTLSRKHTFVNRFSGELYYNITNDLVIQQFMDYYRLRQKTLAFDPWTPARPAIDEPLADLLGGNTDRIAFVHFRQKDGNAGVKIPAESMFSTLAFLKDSGFTIVKGGTEPCPDEFRRFEIVNYAESPIRGFKNDLALLAHAKIALINASGVENFADVMGIPTVSYARWHITLGPFSRKMVILPTLLFDPERQKLLSFAEQMLFFRTRQEFWEGQFFGWHFPFDRYVARAPQADEILEAVQEALALGDQASPLSPLQARFNKIDENGLLSRVQSRLSEFFLERFSSLL